VKELRILLAEDNPGDVLLVEEALEHQKISHELHVVRDGEEALAFVAKIDAPNGVPRPDLVLLDLNLPKIDGPDVLAAFRKHPLCASTPIIVITSSDAIRDRGRMASLGVARYFRKPSDLGEFMRLGALVQEVMDEKNRG
jgi:CheY-like chemotaxis protein